MPPTRHDLAAASTRRLRQPRSTFERAVLKSMHVHAISNDLFPTDEELDRWGHLFAHRTGCKPSDYRQEYHRMWDAHFARSGRDTINVVGLKPSEGDTVQTIPIPGCSYTLRFWTCGLEALSQVFFDFIDTESRQAVNSPDTFRIYTDYPAAATPAAGRRAGCLLKSWEEGFNIKRKDIVAGEERFCETQGKLCCLQRRGQDDFWFEIPRMVAPAAGPPIAHATDAVA